MTIPNFTCTDDESDPKWNHGGTITFVYDELCKWNVDSDGTENLRFDAAHTFTCVDGVWALIFEAKIIFGGDLVHCQLTYEQTTPTGSTTSGQGYVCPTGVYTLADADCCAYNPPATLTVTGS